MTSPLHSARQADPPRGSSRFDSPWTRRQFLRTTIQAGATPTVWTAIQSASLAAQEPDETARIEAAVAHLPGPPAVKPRKPRRLLIFDRNVGYGGHPSARTAARAFKRMGQATGAFTTTVSREPAVFAPESLRRFDAVFFNNTVGNLFTDPDLRRSLVEFVYRGGGLIGVHGTSVAFTQWPGAIEDWPEFGIMLGARGANHRESTERVFIKLDDPTHPLVQCFPTQGFEYRDEFFRFGDPYSRRRVRVLLSFDTDKTNMNQGPPRGQCIRPDNDYAVAWVRGYGRGRVFYCTIAHNPYVFWDPRMLRFYLAAAQFVLGDLPGPTTPSAFLTPAIRARERLGWTVALMPPYSPRRAAPTNRTTAATATGPRGGSVFDTIDRAAEAGLTDIAAAYGRPIRPDTDAVLDASLDPTTAESLRLKLDAATVRLRIVRLDQPPKTSDAFESAFALARRMGADLLVAPAAAVPIPMNTLDALARTYDLDVALEPVAITSAENPLALNTMLKSCSQCGPHVGVCLSLADLSAAAGGSAAGPRALVGHLGNRLKLLRLIPTPSDTATLETVLRQTAAHGRPLTIGLTPPAISTVHTSESKTDESRIADWIHTTTQTIDRICIALAGGTQ